jgi:NTE family protein
MWNNKTKSCDIALEGGGMRGIAEVGVIKALEEDGYKFRNVAGTSAGAILASLLAAGYTSAELYQELKNMPFESFKQSSPLAKALGPVGKVLNVTKTFGLYSADNFQRWIEELFLRKGISTFGDLAKRGGFLKVVAADVTSGKALVMPDDLLKFGINPDTFKISRAVRMSMSIPGFFEPYQLRDESGEIHYIVDGGILNNCPINVLDNGKDELDAPAFAVRFVRHRDQKPANNKKPSIKSNILDLMGFAGQMMDTIIDNQASAYGEMAVGDSQRTIYADIRVAGNKTVGITEFDLPEAQIEELCDNGYNSAKAFLETWNFKDWKNQFRGKNINIGPFSIRANPNSNIPFSIHKKGKDDDSLSRDY